MNFCPRARLKARGILEDYVIESVEVWRQSIEELGLSVNKPVGFRLRTTHHGCDRRLRKFKKAEVL